jgi:uncharacterized protein YpmB
MRKIKMKKIIFQIGFFIVLIVVSIVLFYAACNGIMSEGERKNKEIVDNCTKSCETYNAKFETINCTSHQNICWCKRDGELNPFQVPWRLK